MNTRLLSLSILASSFGMVGPALAADPAPAAAAVGQWLRDPDGQIIGSVRGLSPDGQTAELMVGAYFQPGSHLATVPADALTVANGQVTLRTGTATALNARR